MMFRIDRKVATFNNVFAFFESINRYSDDPEKLLNYVCHFSEGYFSLKQVTFVHAREESIHNPMGQIYPIRENDTVIGYFMVEKQSEQQDKTEFKTTLDDFFSVATIIIENAYLKQREKQLFSDIVDIQLNMLDARTKGGEKHSKNVQSLGLSIAGRMGFSLKKMEALKIGGLLFDVGKIGIPDYILNMEEPMPPECHQIIIKHVYYGKEIIGNFHTITDDIRDITFYHHEHIDGSGYPEGLKGEEIPMAVRIITVCDVFCAMTEQRMYRSALSREEALHKVQKLSNIFYDKQIVDCLEEVLSGG